MKANCKVLTPLTDSTPKDKHETRACTVNLEGLPDSAFSISKLDMNDGEVTGGVGLRTFGDVRWVMVVADNQRVDCTELGLEKKGTFSVTFDSAGEANKTVSKLKDFIHQYCN